jgi:hypothetical protein
VYCSEQLRDGAEVGFGKLDFDERTLDRANLFVTESSPSHIPLPSFHRVEALDFE